MHALEIELTVEKGEAGPGGGVGGEGAWGGRIRPLRGRRGDDVGLAGGASFHNGFGGLIRIL